MGEERGLVLRPFQHRGREQRSVADIGGAAVGVVVWLRDRSTPIGPGVTSATAAADPHKLRLTTDLNGQRMQDGETSLMVFSIWELIEFLSARVTLKPGDVLSTGTPVGVGGFRKIFLKPGDRLRVEVQHVGALDNAVISA